MDSQDSERWDRAISRKKSALELLGPLGFVDNDDGEAPGAIWHRECHITLDTERMSPAQVIAAVLEIGRERGRSEVQGSVRKALGLVD